MDSALRHDVNLPVDLPLSVSWERLSGQHSCPLWLTMVSTGLLLRGCRAGVTPAARRPIRPADMLSRLFQHLFRIRHIMSLAFGHSAAQFAAPLCGAPAPFTYACTPQNMPLCGQLQSGREAMGAGRDTEEGDLQGQGEACLARDVRLCDGGCEGRCVYCEGDPIRTYQDSLHGHDHPNVICHGQIEDIQPSSFTGSQQLTNINSLTFASQDLQRHHVERV